MPADLAAQLAATGVDLSPSAGPPPNREGALSAAEILTTGTPCRAIIQSSQPLGFQKDGLDVWGLVLVFPGANLPAKRRGDIDDGVTIDWAAALTDH